VTLDKTDTQTLLALRRADGATFTELMEIAGLDPKRDLRDADLSGVDFAGCDLRGYDFSGAVLTGASFRGAIVDYAVFERADLTGVVWPIDRMPGSAERSPILHRPAIHARQREIVQVLIKALQNTGAPRAVAVLPPGVGKTIILAEVFLALRRTKAFGRGLILTETMFECKQIASVLQDRGIDIAVSDTFNRQSISRGGVLVETFGNYTRIRNDLMDDYQKLANPLKCTHLGLSSVPTRRRADIAAISASPGAPAIVAFVEPDPLWSEDQQHLFRGKLGSVFEHVTYQYTLEQAIEDGLLTKSEVIDCSEDPIIRRFGRLSEKLGLAGIGEVADNYANWLRSAPTEGFSLMIVPDSEAVDRMLLRLQKILSEKGQASTGQRVAAGLSGKITRAERLRVTKVPGTVVVTTPTVVDQFDLQNVVLIGVYAMIPSRLARLIRNPPPSFHSSTSLRVVDYVGSVARH
jgi:hypothetical protein